MSEPTPLTKDRANRLYQEADRVMLTGASDYRVRQAIDEFKAEIDRLVGENEKLKGIIAVKSRPPRCGLENCEYCEAES